MAKTENFAFVSFRKPKVPDSSPAASYVQRLALCSNRPANVWVSVKRVEVAVRS